MSTILSKLTRTNKRSRNKSKKEILKADRDTKSKELKKSITDKYSKDEHNSAIYSYMLELTA